MVELFEWIQKMYHIGFLFVRCCLVDFIVVEMMMLLHFGFIRTRSKRMRVIHQRIRANMSESLVQFLLLL